MENSRRSYLILFSLLLLFIGIGSYQLFYVKEGYPLKRMITNKEGKSLSVTVIGRTGDTLHFVKGTTEEKFDYPLSNLGWKDQMLAFRLPKITPPPPPQKPKSTDPYIQRRQKEMIALKKKRELFVKEINSQTLPDIIHRNRQDQLLALEQDIKKLEIAIETYKWRRKKD